MATVGTVLFMEAIRPDSRSATSSAELVVPLLASGPHKCKICGGKSTGVHYGVTSCEGCKAFFKRGVVKNAQYKCYFGGNCVISPKSRGWCKSCRFQRCFQSGMSLEGNKFSRQRKAGNGSRQQEHSAFAKDLQKDPHKLNTSPISDSASSGTASSLSDRTRVILPNGNFGTWSMPKNLAHKTPNAVQDLDDGERYDSSSSRRLLENCFARSLMIASGAAAVEDCGDAEIIQRNLNPINVLRHSTFKIHDNPSSGLYTEINIPNDDLQQSQVMSKYWSVMKERNSCLESTIRAVTDGVQEVYLDQIELWSEFMEQSLDRSSVKPPEISLDVMRDIFCENAGDEASRIARFASLLPGYNELEHNEKISRAAARGFESWLLHHARYFRNGQVYYLTHRDQYHYSRYWMEKLFDRDFVDFIFWFMEKINALELTLTETYLLHAVALLRPDDARTENASYMNFLYAHYLDALVHLLGTRKSGMLQQLEGIISSFKSISFIQTKYIHCMDLTKTPFIPWNGTSFLAVKDSLSQECKDTIQLPN